jgi:hypothetical protein
MNIGVVGLEIRRVETLPARALAESRDLGSSATMKHAHG